MFTLNDDLSIYVTRGDAVFFSVTAEDNGKPYVFQAGDIVRIKVYGKKDAENVVLQKDFPVLAATESVDIYLTEDDTKIDDVISKHKDYWYEVELNPFTNPTTIIGYDEDGAKVFRLFPEGDDIPPRQPVKPEDIPIVDDKLDMTSHRPVENQAIARAIVAMQAKLDETQTEFAEKMADTNADVADVAADIVVERARIDNFVAGATADGSEVADIRVDIGGIIHTNAGRAIREHFKYLAKIITDFSYVNGTYITKDGKEYNFASGKSSDYIDVSEYAGENLLLYSCLFDGAGFAVYDRDKVCIAGVDGYSSGANPLYDYYRLTLPTNAHYIRFSLHTSKMEEGKVIIYPGHTGTKAILDIIKHNQYETITIDEASYTDKSCIVGADGSLSVGGDSFPLNASDYVDVSGYGLYDLYLLAVFNNYAGMAFYDGDKKYIEGHSGTSLGITATYPVEVVLKTPANAKYIRFTTIDTHDDYRVRFKENVGRVVEQIKTIEASIPAVQADYSYAVENVLCIGDSLTSGANYVTENGASIQQNIPYYLGRMLNCNTTNAGKSGWSASDWYRDFKNTYNYPNYDTFIIWLGTNYGCGTMPTDDEIGAFVPDDSVVASAANQALYLIKIITDIQAANPDAFIVLCNAFASKSNVATNNETISAIAQKYGLMLLDMSDLTIANFPKLHGGINNPHFGKAGNIYIADRIKNKISEYIAEDALRAEFGYSARTN